MYKIGSTSKLQIEYKKAILVIRRPLGTILSGLFILAIVGSSFFFPSNPIQGLMEGNYLYLIAIAASVFGIVLVSRAIGGSEHVEIDLAARTVVSQQKIFGITYKTSSTGWPAGHAFKYSVDYDSYKKITAIWMVAYSNQANENRQLFRFFDQKTFVDFQKVFNENFPESKILEWHD